MFEPCVEYCYLKFRKQYTPDCDDKCAYAKAVKERDEALQKLAKYEATGFEPEDILKLHSSCIIDVGQTVYVVTKQCFSRPYEVVKCVVTRKSVKKRATFTASGSYKDNCYYSGTFVDKSVNKTVFLSENAAIIECERLNNI